MEKDTRTFGLNPESLSKLLKICSVNQAADDTTSQEKSKAECLRDCLEESPPLDQVLLDSLPEILKPLGRELGPTPEESIGKLLLSSKTDITRIKAIKHYGKTWSASASSKVEHDVAVVVYFAAIASALVFHSQRITQYSYKSLDQSFSSLIQTKWISEEILSLFEKAKILCEQKKGSTAMENRS